jgi:hypothetical protein
MRIGTNPLLQLARRGRALGFAVVALVAAGAGIGTSAIPSSGATRHQDSAYPAPGATWVAASQGTRHGSARSTPTAAEFAGIFIAVVNAYARTHGDRARLANADCVRASAGHYMCSYAIIRPDRRSECHLMQARWTPSRASTLTVTMAGRTPRCATLREAIASLN